MTADEASPPTESTGPPCPEPAGVRSRGAARFVAVFVLVVLCLLTGYRYALDTTANDWYLFQVARHTGWVLGFIGYSATLEKTTGGHLDPAAVRASFRREVQRQVPPVAGLDQGDSAPLTPWEIWRYRAAEHREDPARARVIGPQVLFVLKPGLQHRIEALETGLRTLADDAGDPARVDRLNAEIQALRTEQSAGQGDPEQRRAQQGRFFSFIVVPECGAIEVMAIFLAAVLAFPAGWRARAWGVAIGLPIMYAVNIGRLACLACIGALDSSGRWFTFCHEYVWQAVYVIFVVVVWMAWVEFGVRRVAR